MTILLLGAVLGATALPQEPQFHPPVRLQADGTTIRVEAPGFAFPSWHDVDGDGKPDLVVGQFRDGKMMLYKNLGGGALAKGEWLTAEGDVAKVPGVW